MAIIDKPSDYFNTKLYTGNGGSQSISSVGFQPDLVWLKNRQDADRHCLFDNVRGVEKVIFSHLTDAEQSTNLYGTLTSFDSDGFSLLNGSNSAERTNVSGENYVSWNWLGANGTASNTDGSITSSVSANTTAGFSIVSYTGTGSTATVGHGLGSAPNFVIIKCTSESRSWVVTNSNLGFTGRAFLESTDAWSVNSGEFNNTAPTNSVFTIGGDFRTNKSGATYIAYLFNNIKGFSKTGNYTGNGSTDGTFVYTGMKPSFVMVKRTDASGFGWAMFDNKRDPDNVVEGVLNADTSSAEDTASDWLDFTSNGFKAKFTGGDINANGGSYIYMCFSENPFVTSTGIPTTAR